MTGTATHDGGSRLAAPAQVHALKAGRLVCLFLSTLVWAYAGPAAARFAAGAPAPRSGPEVTQMIQSGDYLIWLDGDGRAIYRARKPAAGKTVGGQQPGAGERETLWQGEPLANPTGISADKAGVIYVTDKSNETVYSLKPGGRLEVIFSGRPFKNPMAVAVSDDGILYVADTHDKKLFSLDRARKEIVTEYDFGTEHAADRLFYSGGMLVAVDRSSRTLYRFVVGKVERPAAETPATEWKHVTDGKHTTVGRGMVTDVKKSVKELSDASADAGVVYLLDAGDANLVLLPLSGGGASATLPVGLLSEKPSALAAADDSLYMAEGEGPRFKRAPALAPLSLFFVGDWTAPDVVGLYTYLKDVALLPLKEYSVDRPVSLEEFTASQKIMPTGYVDHFQVLFCELNPSLCTAEQRRLPPENAPTPPGFVVRLSPGARVLLPDLPVASRYSRRNIRLPLDPKVYKPEFFGRFYNRPLGLIARDLAPKSLDDEKLNELLSLYNPNYEGQDILSKTEGSFGVPVRAGSVSVVVPRADLLNPNSGISILAAKKNVSGFTAANPLHPQSMIAGAPGTPAPFLVEDGCQPPDVPSAVLSQINYCRPGPGELRRRPAVGIIDNLFNPNHPAFVDPALPGRSALNVYRPPNSPEESRPVEVERPNPNFFVKDLDHGTHVAGIIGARPQPGGGVGLLPQALLYGLTVENLTQMQEDEEWSKIRIFNVSLGERPIADGGQPGAFSGTDVLKEFFVQYSHTLFIVSAGNENRPVRKDTLAWLGYLDNVIVVGATNVPAAPSDTAAASPIRLLRMPDGSGSNFDQTRMVLVAPGEKIRSTLFNGQYGEASGTSQATAFVSAAAAALKAAQPSWDAWQIKFRLIATADLWTATDQSNIVFAGELNFKRALLNMENAVFEHENGTVCVGEVETTSLGRKLVIRKGAANLSIPFDRILRVKRNRADSTDYTVIYYEEKSADEFQDRKNRYLRREVNVPAAQMRENYKFNFLPTVPSTICKADGVNLKEMVDFINSINPSSN